MSLKFKAAALAAIGTMALTQSWAQTAPKVSPSPIEFRASTQRDMWHTVMVVSAVVAVVGILDSNSTLTILGVAGVVLSLVETGGNAFQMNARHGLNLVKSGPWSLGYNPFGQTSFAHGYTGARPGAFVQLSFKF